MLNFDETHQEFDGKISDKTPRAHVGKTTFLGLLFFMLVLFSGCTQQADCDIPEKHAHAYVNDSGYELFLESENIYEGFLVPLERTDKYITIDEKDSKVLKFEYKNNLLRIDANKDKIQSIVDQHQDFKEYRYKYTWEQPILNSYEIGDQTYYDTTYVQHTDYSWTTDSSKEGLTGEERIITNVYYGFKIIEDEKGTLKIKESGPYKRIDELTADGYTHIKEDFHKKVLADDITKEPDYESKSSAESKKTNEKPVKSR